MKLFATCAVIVSLAAISGCAHHPIADLNVTKLNQELDKMVCKKGLIETEDFQADSDIAKCLKLYRGDENDKVINRTLRAQLLVEIAARYGASRIENYSKDSVEDARRLLMDFHVVYKQLNASWKNIHDPQNRYRYWIDRTDLTIDILRLVDDATRSVRATLGDVLISGPAAVTFLKNDGVTVLKNLLEDRLYAGAYATALWTGINNAKDDSSQKALWETTDGELKLQCKRIAQLAKMVDDSSLCPQ